VVVRDGESLNLKLSDGEETVVLCVAKIDDFGVCVPCLPRSISPFNWHTIPNEVVEVAIVLNNGPSEVIRRELSDRLLPGGFWYVFIQSRKSFAKISDKHGIPLS